MSMVDMAIGWLAHGGWMWVPGWYLLMSALTYLFYAADKAAARHGEWRTKESTLHLLELLGGWPGALLAQRRLHHKNRKASYQFEFFLVLLINTGILVYVGYRVNERGISDRQLDMRCWVQGDSTNRPERKQLPVISCGGERRGSVSVRFVE